MKPLGKYCLVFTLILLSRPTFALLQYKGIDFTVTPSGALLYPRLQGTLTSGGDPFRDKALGAGVSIEASYGLSKKMSVTKPTQKISFAIPMRADIGVQSGVFVFQDVFQASSAKATVVPLQINLTFFKTISVGGGMYYLGMRGDTPLTLARRDDFGWMTTAKLNLLPSSPFGLTAEARYMRGLYNLVRSGDATFKGTMYLVGVRVGY